jgi:DNA-binding beta-propeller fold protein YncE
MPLPALLARALVAAAAAAWLARAQECTLTTLAGNGVASFVNSPTGTLASIQAPSGIVHSPATGMAYVTAFHRVRAVSLTPPHAVTTLAGSGTAAFADGTGAGASFSSPSGLAADELGALYVADRGTCRLRRIDVATGATTTVAGNPACGWLDAAPPVAGQLNAPEGVCVARPAPPGPAVVYVADTGGHRIRVVTLGVRLATLAGSGSAALADGTGTGAAFSSPRALACQTDGSLLVLDAGNRRVRRVSPGGAVTTLAGGASAVWMDGAGAGASFGTGLGLTLALDAGARLLLPDAGTHRLRALSLAPLAPDAVVSTLAGTGTQGFADGAALSVGMLNAPSGVALRGPGQYLVADTGSHRVRLLVCPSASPTPSPSPGASASRSPSATPLPTPTPSPSPAPACSVTLLAGSALGAGGAADGVGSAALLTYPTCLAVAPGETVYFSEHPGNRIRSVSAGGVVVTLAGSTAGAAAYLDGVGTAARFNGPHGIALSGDLASLFISDRQNCRIRRLVLASGAVATVAGSGSCTWADGVGVLASFYFPEGLALRASDGALFVADPGNLRLRLLAQSGAVSTLAGSGASGTVDGVGTLASFTGPRGLALSASGTTLYVSEPTSSRVREVNLRVAPPSVTTLAGSQAGWMDGLGASAAFSSPAYLVVAPWPSALGSAAPGGELLLLADQQNHMLRSVTFVGGEGEQWSAGSNVAGGGPGAPGLAAGAGSAARFNSPQGIAASPWTGNIYVGDSGSNEIRLVVCPGASPTATPSRSPSPGASASATRSASPSPTLTPSPPPSASAVGCTVATIAGTGTPGFSNGVATAAQLSSPSGVAWDAASSAIFIADSGSHSIRRLAAGALTTFAGSTASASGCIDNVLGTSARFTTPADVAADAAGALYVADSACHRIRRVLPGSTVSTFAGSGGAGFLDSAVGTSALFNTPMGVAVSRVSGNVYVADFGNHRVRRITPGQAVATIAGSAAAGFLDSAVGTLAQLLNPRGLAVDASEQLYVADTGNQRLRVVTPGGAVRTLAGGGPGTAMYQDGTPGAFASPFRLALRAGSNSSLVLADFGSARIRSVEVLEGGSGGSVGTLAGSGLTAPFADGSALAATFSQPSGVAIDGALGRIYIASAGDHRLRQVTCPPASPTPTRTPSASTGALPSPSPTPSASPPPSPSPSPTGCLLQDFVGLANAPGSADGAGSAGTLNTPSGLALHPAETFIAIADRGSCRIRRVTLGGAALSTLAGTGTCSSVDGTGTASATLNAPEALAFDASGANLYVAETGGHRVRRITVASALTLGLSGSGVPGFADGPGASAQFLSPAGIVVAPDGHIYVGDTANHRIRVVTVAGVAATLAGSGAPGHADGSGTAAVFYDPRGMAADGAGTLYCADSRNNRVRAIAIATRAVTTLAGRGGPAAWADGAGAFAALNNPHGLFWSSATGGPSGALLLADNVNHRLRLLSALGGARGAAVSTLVGNGNGQTLPGAALAAGSPVFTPRGVVQTASGDVYFSEFGGHVVRRIVCGSASPTPSATPTLSPGASPSRTPPAPSPGASLPPSPSPSPPPGCTLTAFLGSGSPTYAEGAGAGASFNGPCGMTIAPSGVAYIADTSSNRLRVVSAGGVTSLLAGSTAGFLEGTGGTARFLGPRDAAFDPTTGNLVVADTQNQRIRLVSPAGVTSTLAGNGGAFHADGTGAGAAFSGPEGVAVHSVTGAVFVADTNNHRIRMVTPGGVVTTLAGAPAPLFLDGTGSGAYFALPRGVALSPSRATLFVADAGNQRVRALDLDSLAVTTLAGNSGAGYRDGAGDAATFSTPIKLAWDARLGALLVADQGNARLRAVFPSAAPGFVGSATATLAGTGISTSTTGPALGASLNSPCGVLSFPPGGSVTPGDVLVSEAGGHFVRRYTCASASPTPSPTATLSAGASPTSTPSLAPSASASATPSATPTATLGGCLVSTLAGSGSAGAANGVGAGATFNTPTGLALDASQNLYIGDRGSHLIRRVVPGTATVTTFSGNGVATWVDNNAASASFFNPSGLAVDATNIYVADRANNRIRRVFISNGLTITVAGNTACSWLDSTGNLALFCSPQGLAVDALGNLWVADTSNNVRSLTCLAPCPLLPRSLSPLLHPPPPQTHSPLRSASARSPLRPWSPLSRATASPRTWTARAWLPSFLRPRRWRWAATAPRSTCATAATTVFARWPPLAP